MIPDKKIQFISFGSDKNYINYSKDLLSKISVAYPDSQFDVYGPKDIPEWINQYAQKYPKGYGYWLWKPYLIFETLKKVDEGNVVVYLDGRCDASGVRLPWLDEFLKSKNHKIMAWQMSLKERNWTSYSVFKRMNISYYGKDAFSGQFAATVLVLKKDSYVLDLVFSWLDFLEKNKSICRDSFYTKFINFKFRHNRHDQSVLSLMLKKNLNIVLQVGSLNIENVFKVHSKKHPN